MRSLNHKPSTTKGNRKAKLHSSRTIFQKSSPTIQRERSVQRGHSRDDYKVDLSLDSVRHYPISVDKNRCYIALNGSSGVIYLTSKHIRSRSLVCYWRITVEKDQFIAARIQGIPQNCPDPGTYQVHIIELKSRKNKYNCLHDTLIYTEKQHATFKWVGGIVRNVTTFYFFFTTVTRDGNLFLPATMTSSAAGYVTSLGYGGKARYSRCASSSHKLTVPNDHSVMISFPHVDLDVHPACADKVSVYAASNNARRLVMRVCGDSNPRPQLFNTSLIVEMVTDDDEGGFGFKMDFSFHPASKAPLKTDGESWNCSGSNYPAFKQHVHCDLTRDCAGGEDDEGAHCPFSSPLCNGSLALGANCYASFWSEKPVTWHGADRACRAQCGILAVVRTVRERKAVWEIFDYTGRWSPAFVGLREIEQSFLSFRLNQWVWTDEVMAYRPNITYRMKRGHKKLYCAYMTQSNVHRFVSLRFDEPEDHLTAAPCSSSKLSRYFCQFTLGKPPAYGGGFASNARPPDLAHDIDRVWSQYAVTHCPPGHVTFSFMSCEPSTDCGTQQHQTSCTTRVLVKPRQDKLHRHAFPAGDNTRASTSKEPSSTVVTTPSTHAVPAPTLLAVTVHMFSCADSTITVPYALVCDYVAHCPGESDETFCIRAKCPQYTCSSGQCFSFRQMCDRFSKYDCLDRSDEKYCSQKEPIGYLAYMYAPSAPTVTRFEIFSRLGWSLNIEGTCPETHFLCSGAESNCLPVYMRCNGHVDCPDREDEDRCDRYKCPGFYRCRESKICVHATHFCDNRFHCPQGDDELYCRQACPAGCLCQGTALVCTEKFPAREQSEIRYLDASGSAMKPGDLFSNMGLIWVSLASCGIGQISGMSWPNLIRLDLSQNNMSVVSMAMFYNLTNLRTLILADNPLMSLVEGSVCDPHKFLVSVDLSKTLLREFDSKSLSCYPYITHINISQCPLHTIKDAGFTSTPYLANIDMSCSPVFNFPRAVFKALSHLGAVAASNYKLCCAATLPAYFNEKNCLAPQDEISSCDDLLKSSLFRGCMWVFAAFTVLGNLSCFIIKVSFRAKTSRSGFSMFVTNLTVSDFSMGVYLMIVGVADIVYRGKYMWYDSQWKSSTACAIAGFMSLLSCEMSAFTICLITLDRFIVITFPFTDLRFQRRSAPVTCGLVWAVGVVLSSVPLFPMTPRWEFYGQTGICIPLPITKERFRGHGYAFGVLIVLNFTLFVLIAAGQLSIYWSVRSNSVKANSSRKPQDLIIARRLFSVAATDFLCWFPIGLFAVLSAMGFAVSSEVSVAMAIFVLPVNSAMNPFLYTFNVFAEKRKKAREAELMKILERRVLLQTRTTAHETTQNCRKTRQ